MNKYKVLIVDDSPFMRKSISMIIESNPLFEVVAMARNGFDALEKLKEYKPDVITMDVEMPEMDGIECVKHIMKINPLPILMLSSLTQDGGSRETIEALQSGAVDFFYKDDLLSNEEKGQELISKLSMVANVKISKINTHANIELEIGNAIYESRKDKMELFMIGSSTGGPSALNHIIEALPSDFPVPVVIIQHMPDGFTKLLAEKFDTMCNLHVKEVERGDILEKGTVYIAPAGYQTTIQKNGSKFYLNVSKDYDSEQLYKPSVDVTIASACDYFRDRMAVAILTGMGEDGKKACEIVKKNGGYIVAESEETAVVYGMPKAVIEAGYADEVAPIHNIYRKINKIFY